MVSEQERVIRKIDGCPQGDDWVMADLSVSYNPVPISPYGTYAKVSASFRWTKKDRELTFVARLTRTEWEELINAS